MPSLVIVRHGEALPGPSDAERALSEQGKRQVERLASHLSGRLDPIGEIRHSGLRRARETAEILAATIPPHRGLRSDESLRPNGDPDVILAQLEDGGPSLMLVSHMPLVETLVSALLRGRTIPFRTATAALLSNRSGTWHLDAIVGP